MINYTDLHYDFVEIVASSLHSHEAPTLTSGTASEIMERMTGWKNRYRRDGQFRARVDMAVACLVKSVGQRLES